MAIVPCNYEENHLESTTERFFRQWALGTLLGRCNFVKEAGFSCLQLVHFVFMLAFTQKNLYQTLRTRDTADGGPEKDAVYRMLNSLHYNWRKLLLLFAMKVIGKRVDPLTSADRERVFVVDDSLFSRNRSKAVELLARVYDHASRKYVRGFRMLTLGWSDGNTFLPVAFSLLSSANPKNRLQEVNEDVDRRTVGYRRRQESMQKAPQVLLSLIQQALQLGISAHYVLFDSWFAFPQTILKIREEGLDVICMLKAMPRVFYTYQGKRYALKSLYAAVKKKRGRAKILASVIVTLGTTAQGEDVQAKIVFVRDRHRSRQWLALLSTDIELSEEEIVRIYGKRWDIEVFFKMSKSYLKLAKEFQGRTYDMMVAHTTIVCLRYLMLAVESREHNDPRTLGNLFYECCDELQDLTFASAILSLMDLLKQAVRQVVVLTEQQFQDIFDHFLAALPPLFQRSLGISACES